VTLAVSLDELYIYEVAKAIEGPAGILFVLFAAPGPLADLPDRKQRIRTAAEKIEDLLLLGIDHTYFKYIGKSVAFLSLTPIDSLKGHFRLPLPALYARWGAAK